MSEQDHGTTEGNANPVGMAIAVFVGAIALVIGIMLLAQFAIGTRPLGAGLDKAAAEAAIKERISPDVIIATAGVAGAPKTGDKAGWAPRVAQGKDTLYKHAIGGFQGKMGVMPAKGGNTSLSDADVKAAVDYMLAALK